MFTIVAGTGYTGRRVLERLPAAEVAGLSRTAIDTDRPFYEFDFDSEGALPLALPEAYAVLYTCPPDGEHDGRLRRFLSLLNPGPARFVYISTTGVYGDTGGAQFDETRLAGTVASIGIAEGPAGAPVSDDDGGDGLGHGREV